MPTPTNNSVASLQKGIEVLFLFSEAEPMLRLQDISSRLRLPKSTAYRFVRTLRDAGLLVRDAESRRYRLGARLLLLQSAIIRPRDLRALALPFLRDLVERSGETAHLTERRDTTAVILEVVESPFMLRMAPRRGQRFPLHAGAFSRAILAFLPSGEIDHILQTGDLRRFTPHTPTSRAVLKRLLNDVRKVGYALSFQEITLGACGISAPILGPDGSAVASIGVSGPMQRLTEEKRNAIVPTLKKAAADLSLLLCQEPADLPVASHTMKGAQDL